MELDEKLFHFLWKTKKKFDNKKLSNNAVVLEKEKIRLAGVASAFFGKTIFIKEAEKIGGLIGDSLFLPKYIDLFDKTDLNFQLYLYRIIFSNIAYNEKFILKNKNLSLLDHKLISLISFPYLKNIILKEFPIFTELLNNTKKGPLGLKNGAFLKCWQEAMIDDSFLNKYSLPNKQKLLIKKLINPQNTSWVEIKKNYPSIKEEILSTVKINKEEFNLAPLIIPIPITSQKLAITNTNDSIITNAKKNKTLKKTKSKERVKSIQLDEKDPDCNPASLLMEGVQTADIFSGGRKMVDGSDELDDHFDAINELEIRELTRSSKQTQSVFKAEIAVEFDYAIEEEQENTNASFSYDEWDYKSKHYKKDWCQLFVNKVLPTADLLGFEKYKKDIVKNNKKEIERPRLKLGQILFLKRAKNRQPDGPQVDIDALVNAKADILSGHTPSANLYISKRKAPTPLSVVILLDASLSADSFIAGKRVMDIAKESIIVIQEVLEGIFENLMVASFYSNTRKNCTYNIIKGFNESWPLCAPRIDNIKPSGYTRIGVALRHSMFQLNNVKAKKKVILLLSDGKPTDYDAYEGKIGIHDIRQAVREANGDDINIFSLAIDKESRFYFPKLFGPKNYEVLSSSKTLPEQLIKLLTKI